ncbi:MAG: hypothetical protein Q4C81_04165 [Kocuria sp.]|nr:hypothetical protein [Kocuria sp.]
MSTIAAPVQDTLPLDLDLAPAVEPAYDEAAREADRELCQRYFKAWCGTAFSIDGELAGHPEISFEEFQAAADRLAEGAEEWAARA